MAILDRRRGYWEAVGWSPRGQKVTGYRHDYPRQEKGSLGRKEKRSFGIVGAVAGETWSHWVASW
ncbi:hypothetical protein DPMN_152300 [Dreissena polymorpha]|uniref:Uncharacterized protein n=1 Tax=Dreissena polymorpha TaxID=45954 RepID=A0A9D4FGZ5_DREPO|nr:hypothetical protein DPMN_152300 [Dreissena polymorpha]